MKKIIGFAAVLLSTLFVFLSTAGANQVSELIEVLYGVNIAVEGQPQDFPEDMAPFITEEGRAFVSVKAIAEALGFKAVWDESTSTVYVSRAPLSVARSQENNGITVALSSLPWSFDPAQQSDASATFVHRQIYNTLLEINPESFEIMPSLAINWDMPDAQTINVELRRGVTFHNGAPLTARDVQFSLIHTAQSSAGGVILDMISAVTMHDDYNLTIHLEYPFAPVLRHLAHVNASILSAAAIERGHDLNYDNPIGTGPYMFEELLWDEALVLTRNPNYWGEPTTIETLTIREIPDSHIRLLSAEVGEVDIAIGISIEDIPLVEKSPNLSLMRTPNFTVQYIGFNVQREPFNNPLVTQAINYALDIDAINEAALLNTGSVARAPITDITWGFAETEPFATNPDRARELLAEAGFSDGFQTTIWLNHGNMQRLHIAEMVQFQLHEIGIDVRIELIDWAAFLDLIAQGEHDMFVLGWGTSTGDADRGLYPLFHSSMHGAGNYTFHSDSLIDALLEASREEIDPDLRREIYRKIFEQLRENPSMVPLQQGEMIAAVFHDVRGYNISPFGDHNISQIYFAE